MATHEITLLVPHGIEIRNVDIEVVVRQDDELLGRVRISKGSIDWVPARGRRTKFMLWEKFDDLMRREGSTRR